MMQFLPPDVMRVLSIPNFCKCLYSLLLPTSMQVSKAPGFEHLIVLEVLRYSSSSLLLFWTGNLRSICLHSDKVDYFQELID